MSQNTFEPGQHVMKDGEEFIFHCYMSNAMAKEDYDTTVQKNEYSYIKSTKDEDNMAEPRKSQNGCRFEVCDSNRLKPMPQVLHSKADSLNEISI